MIISGQRELLPPFLEDQYPFWQKGQLQQEFSSIEKLRCFSAAGSVLLHFYDFGMHVSSKKKHCKISKKEHLHPCFWLCASPAPPWRRNGTPVPTIHVRRRWLAQRHWQCECHWPASNKWGVKSSFSCLWWQNLTKLPNLYQKPMDSKLWVRFPLVRSLVVLESTPPLRSFHAKGWSKCSPHGGFPQKNSIPTVPFGGFVGWLQLPCPYPPPRSLALVRRAVHALVEGRKAGKSPYQNQGLGKSFSSFGRFLLLESGSLQVSSIFFAILNYLDFLTLYLHANIENKNRSTQISIDKVYPFFQKNIPLPNFALPIHGPVRPFSLD